VAASSRTIGSVEVNIYKESAIFQCLYIVFLYKLRTWVKKIYRRGISSVGTRYILNEGAQHDSTIYKCSGRGKGTRERGWNWDHRNASVRERDGDD